MSAWKEGNLPNAIKAPFRSMIPRNGAFDIQFVKSFPVYWGIFGFFVATKWMLEVKNPYKA